MTIEYFSNPAQDGFRRWALDVHNDELMFDANGSSLEFWAWVCFQLKVSKDNPDWFPRGKWATIQVLEEALMHEAEASIGLERKA